MGKNDNLGLVFRYEVEIGNFKGNFSKVSGLEGEIDLEEYQEGGVNGYVHMLPRRVQSGKLVLERGVGDLARMIKWFQHIKEGKLQKSSGTIKLRKEDNTVVRTWEFQDAFPTKWTGPSLNALGSEVAIETLEITHSGLKEKS